jgi:RNA polymerase sigma-70 factor, ECF subfamily
MRHLRAPPDADEAGDHDLVARIRSGEEQAFRSLFRRYAPTAMALAQRVLRHGHLAEETVQEAFLAVWRNPERFDPDRGSVRSWLMTTVHHRAVDVVRREEAQQRRGAQAEAEPMVDLTDPAVTVVEEVTLLQERLAVRRALEALPQEQRRVIELMYFDGYTQSRVAELLELPLGTVKSRTLLGMRRLRAALLEMER